MTKRSSQEATPPPVHDDEAGTKVNEEINAKINDVVKDLLNNDGNDDDATARDDDSSTTSSSNDPAAATTASEVEALDAATAEKVAASMALNEAFIAMESMRKANLEEEYRMATKFIVQRAKDNNNNNTDSIVLPDLHEFCTACLRQHRQDDHAFDVYQQQQALNNQNATYHQAQHQLLQAARHKRRQRQWKVKSPPCLICAAPVCKKHADAAYYREKISLCRDCAPLFQRTPSQSKQDIYKNGKRPSQQHSFVMTQILRSKDTSPAERQRWISHMMDAYDRALLLLQYSCQSRILDVLLGDLEDTKHAHNHVNLGSSGMGLLSGITGMGAVGAQAAAAVGALTILSPAGPPLLIASILLGGSAAVATTSTEAYAHFSQANQLANRILSLHTLLVNLTVIMEELKTNNDNDDDTVQTSLEQDLPAVVADDDDDASVEEVFQDEPVNTSDDDSTKDPSKKGISFDSQETADMSDETTVATKDETPAEPEKDGEAESGQQTPAAAYEMDGIDDDDDDDKNAVASTVDKNDHEESTIKSDDDLKLETVQDTEDVAESQEAASKKGDEKEEDDKKEEEKAIPAQGSAAVRAAMPLVPLVDDAALGFFQMLSASGPTGNARVALSRAGTNAMKVAQFASLACGALCAATIYMEVRNLNNTLNSLRAGSPCDKAQKLRKIRDELGMFPETHVMAEELRASLQKEESDKVKEVVKVDKKDKVAEKFLVTEEVKVVE